jgi:hypothetical protein
MPADRYRLPEGELYAIAHVPLAEQIEVQSEPVPPPADWQSDPMPWLDSGSGDADSD